MESFGTPIGYMKRIDHSPGNVFHFSKPLVCPIGAKEAKGRYEILKNTGRSWSATMLLTTIYATFE